MGGWPLACCSWRSASSASASLLVPLYNTFCHTTGLNGTTGEATARPAGGVDLSRTVTVEFTSTVMPGLPWKFQPTVRRLQIHPGEPATATYLAANLGGELRYGQGDHEREPRAGRENFKKIECSAITLRRSRRISRGSCRSCFL